jgi:hypothetical protein
LSWPPPSLPSPRSPPLLERVVTGCEPLPPPEWVLVRVVTGPDPEELLGAEPVAVWCVLVRVVTGVPGVPEPAAGAEPTGAVEWMLVRVTTPAVAPLETTPADATACPRLVAVRTAPCEVAPPALAMYVPPRYPPRPPKARGRSCLTM